MIWMENITKTYRLGDIDVPVLKGIDLAIEEGEYVAIMGVSGSGKSTLMNIIGCLDRPSGGHYILEGRNLTTLNNDELAFIRNQRIGFVFQQFNLLPRSTALDNVMLPMVYASVVEAPASKASHGSADQSGIGRAISQPSQSTFGWTTAAGGDRSCPGEPSRTGVGRRTNGSARQHNLSGSDEFAH